MGRISTRCGITYCYSLFGDRLVAVGACVPFKVTNEQLKDDACTYTIPSVQNKTASLICLENFPIFSYCVMRRGTERLKTISVGVSCDPRTCVQLLYIGTGHAVIASSNRKKNESATPVVLSMEWLLQHRPLLLWAGCALTIRKTKKGVNLNKGKSKCEGM